MTFVNLLKDETLIDKLVKGVFIFYCRIGRPAYGPADGECLPSSMDVSNAKPLPINACVKQCILSFVTELRVQRSAVAVCSGSGAAPTRPQQVSAPLAIAARRPRRLALRRCPAAPPRPYHSITFFVLDRYHWFLVQRLLRGRHHSGLGPRTEHSKHARFLAASLIHYFTNHLPTYSSCTTIFSCIFRTPYPRT